MMQIPVSVWLLSWVCLSIIVTPLIGRFISTGMGRNSDPEKATNRVTPLYPDYEKSPEFQAGSKQAAGLQAAPSGAHGLNSLLKDERKEKQLNKVDNQRRSVTLTPV